METRAEELRRKIAYYRRRLEEGVDAELAVTYTTEIVRAEEELARLTRGDEKHE